MMKAGKYIKDFIQLKYFYSISVFILIFFCHTSFAQEVRELNEADKSALEGIIVEKYYTSDASDNKDTTGGYLPVGSVTYRIYVDMKPDYTLQVVYGSAKHELRIKTTTSFFNNTYIHAATGLNVHNTKINENTVALDSWLTMNSATRNHAGVLKSEDKDGSIITRSSLSKADGLTSGNLPMFKPYNLDMSFFNKNGDDSVFYANNGGWAAINGTTSGTKGPTPENRVLIAQLTTNGKLSFELNVQIGTPSGGTVNFVAKNPEGSEIKFDGLTYNN